MHFVRPVLALFSAWTLSAAMAQPMADKPVRLVVPYAAGGNVDSAARAIAPGLSRVLRQPVVVENKPGAGGMLAGESVAKSVADGTTLFISSNGPVLHSPLIYDRAAYDWRRDFAPVGSVSFTPMVLLAASSLTARTVPEMLEQARQRPGQLGLATPGAGSTNHLAAERLQMEQGVRFNMVHYKGTAPAMTDLLGGHVQLSFDQVSAALQHIRAGKVQALAVTTARRLPQLPDVPTFAEAGIQNFDVATFVGIFAPAATPKETVAQLNAALAQVLADPPVAEKFEAMGAQARASTPEDFLRYLQREDATWIPVIQKAAIKLN